MPRRVPASALEVQTSTPGFLAQVTCTVHVDLQTALRRLDAASRARLAGSGRSHTDVRSGEHIALSLAGHPYRYYLVWLTTLPADMQSATIDELTLFK